jgi:hypothetical protein
VLLVLGLPGLTGEDWTGVAARAGGWCVRVTWAWYLEGGGRSISDAIPWRESCCRAVALVTVDVDEDACKQKRRRGHQHQRRTGKAGWRLGRTLAVKEAVGKAVVDDVNEPVHPAD